MNRFSLAGKSALITGASSGFGAHFTRTLAAAGAESIVVAARRLDRIESLADSVRTEHGTNIVPVAMDVTCTESIRAAFDQAQDELGVPCNILLNNAGIANSALVGSIREDEWDKLMATNLRGCFFVAQEAASRLVDHGLGGSIVNIASILGLRPQTGLLAYSVAKAGVVQMTKSLALELTRSNIRVNSICPGYIRTEMNADWFDSEAGQRFVARLPSQRLGRLGELDGPVLLLSSDAGSFITGSVIAVDGGHLCNSL